MRPGLAAWGLRRLPLEEQFAVTSRLGLELLELDLNLPDIGKTPEYCARYGVSPECGCVGNDFTVDDTAGELARVKANIDTALLYGVKIIRIFAGFASDFEMNEMRIVRMLDALRKANEYAILHGIVLASETHGGVAVEGTAVRHFASASTRIDIWKRILETGVSMNYDPANLMAAGIDGIAFYKRFSEHVKYVHLKDFAPAPGGLRPAACGEGLLDWTQLLEVLSGYDGPALIEYEITDDVEDGMLRSLQFLKNKGVR